MLPRVLHLSVFLICAAFPAGAITLDEIPGANARALSGGGRYVVGDYASPDGKQAFRLDLETGVMDSLGDLPGGDFRSVARGVSADGSRVVGKSQTDVGDEAFLWDAASGSMIGLGTLPNDDGGKKGKKAKVKSEALGISDDGSMVFGKSSSSEGDQAFAFDVATMTLLPLGDLAGGKFKSDATAISSSGMHIAGTSKSDQGTEAFRWDASSMMMQGLGDLPGGKFKSEATAISAAGTHVVGQSSSDLGSEAFIWSALTGEMRPLGDLPGGKFKSEATDVSGDGAVVVGFSRGPDGKTYFIWDEANGMRDLTGVLLEEYGVDLAGWDLAQPPMVSDDGTEFFGLAKNPDGDVMAWNSGAPESGPGAQEDVPAPLVPSMGAWGFSALILLMLTLGQTLLQPAPMQEARSPVSSRRH